MLLLTLLSIFFLWLLAKELFVSKEHRRDAGIDPTYVAIIVVLVIATGYLPAKYGLLKREVLGNYIALTGVEETSFHCNSAFDSIFDNRLGVAAHASPITKKVVFQVSRCGELMKYLDDPEGNPELFFALHIFTHEAMHIIGEMHEPKADCMALQRNMESARLFKLPLDVVARHLKDYYLYSYPRHPYFSDECRKNGAFDESIADAPWNLY